MPNPFARHFSTFKGVAVYGGEHAAVHAEFEYEDAYGTNTQVFSSKEGWPSQESPEQNYRFHYQGKPYDLEYLDVVANARHWHFLFPQSWKALLAKRKDGARSSAGGSRKEQAMVVEKFELESVVADSQGGLNGLSFRVPDEIQGTREFELSWFQPEAGVREVQVLEDGKIALSARCRQLKKDELKLANPPLANFDGWQRVTKPSREEIAKLEIEALDPDLFAVRFPASNCQSLVLVQGDGVSVFEAPVSPRHSELLLQAIRKRLGEVPVARVYLTHHHPAHAGGVATYAQAGIPIVTTPQNAEFFSAVIGSWRRAQPTAEKRASQHLHFEIVRDKQHFGEEQQGVVAINLGKDSAHTDEHLVFYLEKHNLVFNGDLFYVAKDAKAPTPAGKRAKGLHGALSRSVPVNDTTRIVSAWPVKETKKVVSWPELEASAELAR